MNATAKKPAQRPASPKTDEEARELAIKQGWGPWLKRFPGIAKVHKHK